MRHHLTKSACSFALLAFTASAHAAHWQLVDFNDNVSVAVDTTSIRFTGARAKAWYLFSYTKDAPIPGTYPQLIGRSSKQLSIVDCDERTSGALQVVWYDDAYGNGKSVTSFAIKPTKVELTDVIPGSIGEVLLDSVCKLRSKHG